MKVYNCLHCGTENKWYSSKTNKYCNNICQGKYKWEHETILRIELGKCSQPETLKKYLVFKYGLECVECHITSSYNDKPIVLQLDHIDGNSDNNMPSNLRLLCPNCHSQTDTYGAKGQGVRYHKKHAKRNLYLQKYKS